MQLLRIVDAVVLILLLGLLVLLAWPGVTGWGMALVVLLLLASRLFFSFRLAEMTRVAQQAQRVAEHAVETRTNFLATLSHEIRTPMNGVIGMTRLMMNTPLSRKQAEFMGSIRLSGEHLLTVIDDVLDFSRIEAGKLDLKHEPVELRGCIEETLNLLVGKTVGKSLELAYAVDPAIPLFIEGDRVRLRQILTNLVGNAVKFTAAGSVTVSVVPVAQVGDSLELEFNVSDTGVGIPANRLDSIFEQFSQVENSLCSRCEGTGLGLAITRHLVGRMGGRIWAESTLGGGSSFRFIIRTRKVLQDRLAPFLHANRAELVGKRILIVGSNPVSSQFLYDSCRTWGCRVDCAHTMAEVMSRLVPGTTYDAGLIDSGLRGEEALAIARLIRQKADRQTLPLILLVPPDDSHPGEDARNVFNLSLIRPVTRSHLFDGLLTVLGNCPPPTLRVEEPVSRLGERLPLSILLVEDNPVNQVVASSILDEMAYSSDLAAQGEEAVAAVQRKHYDVVFMDMQMPVMDGLEATRRIRAQLPPEQQPVIIAMTANAMEGDKDVCLQAGMNDYISKPVLPEAVAAALKRWCVTKSESPVKEKVDDTVSA